MPSHAVPVAGSSFPSLVRGTDSPCTVTRHRHIPSLSSCESLERVNLQLALVPGLSGVIYLAVARLQPWRRLASRAEEERIFHPGQPTRLA